MLCLAERIRKKPLPAAAAEQSFRRPQPCSLQCHSSSSPHFPAGKCRVRRHCHHTADVLAGSGARPLPCSHRLRTGPGLPLPRAWSHGKRINHVQEKLPGKGISVPGAEECLHSRKWDVIKPQKPPNASSERWSWTQLLRQRLNQTLFNS